MIVICIIVTVIGSFICAVLRVKIDEWLRDSSMKRGRLSLGRRSQNEAHAGDACNALVEISDDDSFESSLRVQKSTSDCVSTTSRETADAPNCMTNACKSNSKQDVSENSSSDEDVVIVNDIPNSFIKSQSMFNWNKPRNSVDKLWNGIRMTSATDTSHQSNFPENNVPHSSKKKTFTNTSKKKQKLMTDWRSNSDYSDDELMSDIPDVLQRNNSPPQVGIQYDRMIAGIKVRFPVVPYPCQLAVVNSLIEGCTKEQNCLLESPTGSGKTLALLCGVLAWQDHYCSEKIYREQSDGMDGVESSSCDDDPLNYNFFLNPSQYFNKDNTSPDNISDKNKPWRVPKVYYGTRTHKQIEQVVRELKKTVYRNKRMTILSSRDHTCIQETNKNKTELCNELLDPLKFKTCQYYDERSKNRASMFTNMQRPWDIEDLVSLGKHIKACPFFGARSLMADAEIIFCPYNYLLYPEIRESLQISLNGNIVILDEAHNIEDMCRDAANVILRDDEIINAAKDCEYLSEKRIYDRIIYETIQKYLMDFLKFFKDIEVEENDFNGMVSKCWPGDEFRVLLDMNNVGCPRFPDFLTASMAAIRDFMRNIKEEKIEKMMLTISRETKTVLEHLCFAMEMIGSDIFVNDYRMYVVETVENIKVIKDGWISKNVNRGKVRTMKLMCMNPAVIFAPLAHDARSVILASGTLTPTTSFQSELGAQFARIINPNHIIPKHQVYVRRISQAPNGESLKAVFNAVNKWNFQDNLGNLVLQICDVVPYGVLCFFSSYNVMNIIHERWKNNGMWDKLSKLKTIFTEPKNNKELPEVMRAYRNVIEESSSKSFREACGAVMFAVFRGKMAEGIDFSDNEARCVLAIGIPYLLKNNDVNMKMEYNNSKASKGLLSGSDWYTVNAFRALNQAIGRCVRHINDWGAVLLVDERFMQPKYNDYLPKWIRTNIKSNENDLEIDLQDFVAIQAARERGKKCIED